MSHHIGDVESYRSYRGFVEGIEPFKRLFEIAPQARAYDLRPGYLSSQYALGLKSLAQIAVQHHRAHIASCMAENGCEGPVIGVAWDGTGYGSKNRVWGGISGGLLRGIRALGASGGGAPGWGRSGHPSAVGDMVRVPGSRTDLFRLKSKGADVRIVYSPLDCLNIARSNPERQVVFFAIGFETTAPANAMTVLQARQLGIDNFFLLVSQVRVPQAVTAILQSPHNRVQGFLGPGHVCTIVVMRTGIGGTRIVDKMVGGSNFHVSVENGMAGKCGGAVIRKK